MKVRPCFPVRPSPSLNPTQRAAAKPPDEFEVYLPPAVDVPPEPVPPERRYQPPLAGFWVFGGMAAGVVLGATAGIRQGWTGAALGALCGALAAPANVTLANNYLHQDRLIIPAASTKLKVITSVASVAIGASLGALDGRLVEGNYLVSFLTLAPLTSITGVGAAISPWTAWEALYERGYDGKMEDYELKVQAREKAIEQQLRREEVLTRLSRPVEPVDMEFEEDSVAVGDFHLPRSGPDESD